jgi:hypothetical protein
MENVGASTACCRDSFTRFDWIYLAWNRIYTWVLQNTRNFLGSGKTGIFLIRALLHKANNVFQFDHWHLWPRCIFIYTKYNSTWKCNLICYTFQLPSVLHRYFAHGPLPSVLMSCMIWCYPHTLFKYNLPRHQNIIIASHRATRPEVRRTLRARVDAMSLINSTSHRTRGTTGHQSMYWYKCVLISLLSVSSNASGVVRLLLNSVCQGSVFEWI